MSKIIHDLTDTLPWVNGVKAKCRNYIGHYGDTYVLPERCFIGIHDVNGDKYGRIYFKGPEPCNRSTITVSYCKNEPQAYAKFMRELASSPYCEIMDKYKQKLDGRVYGEKTIMLYKQLDLPLVHGVTILSAYGKIRGLSTRLNRDQIRTYIHLHVLESGKEAIIKVFKEHLKKMPADWLAARHIPEIYLG